MTILGRHPISATYRCYLEATLQYLYLVNYRTSQLVIASKELVLTLSRQPVINNTNSYTSSIPLRASYSGNPIIATHILLAVLIVKFKNTTHLCKEPQSVQTWQEHATTNRKNTVRDYHKQLLSPNKKPQMKGIYPDVLLCTLMIDYKPSLAFQRLT